MTVQAVSITSEGWAYLNSRTWHPTMWLGEDTDVECYEVAWDGGGRPSVTGERKVMTLTEARATWLMACACGITSVGPAERCLVNADGTFSCLACRGEAA